MGLNRIKSHCLQMYGSKYVIRISRPNDIAPLVLQSINNLPLWSYDALKVLYIGLQDMTIDFCLLQRGSKTGSEKAQYTRTMKKAKKTIYFTPRDREVLLRVIYDSILGAEGMGRLRGFGITNRFGDNIKGNPEINRMSRGG